MVWRRVEISSAASLAELDVTVRAAIGWCGEQDHTFEGVRTPAEERSLRVSSALPRPGDRLRYLYDSAEGWVHEILVEEIRPARLAPTPKCLDGEGACPPGSCGGPWGYAELLAALADPGHRDHARALERLGLDFDPSRVPVHVTPSTEPAPFAESHRSLMARLVGAPFLTRALEEAILALGDEATRPLALVARGPVLEARSTAALLLARIGTPAAGRALLDVLCRSEPTSEIFALVSSLLTTFGCCVLEPLLQALAGFDADHDETRLQAVRGVLSALEIHDPRIYDALITAFEEDAVFGATALARYGDPRAAHVLEPALDALLDLGECGDQEAIVEIAAALEALGRRLGADQVRRIADINAALAREEFVRAP